MRRGLITGASRGIGRAIAIRLASEGYHLALNGRNEAALNETVELVKKAGGEASLIFSDLSSGLGIEKVVEEMGAEPLHLLVNNAGVAYVKPMEEISSEEWRESLAVNVTAPFILTQRLFKIMPAGASVVNILSVAARVGFAGWSSYCASKFALEGLMQSIREELRPRKIRVINVYPSATRTGLWNGVEGDWPKDRMIAPEEVAEAVVYAVSRPVEVLVENISVGDISGTL
jgi:3-oxoacyl-[acyl-carrier protein] reductase